MYVKLVDNPDNARGSRVIIANLRYRSKVVGDRNDPKRQDIVDKCIPDEEPRSGFAAHAKYIATDELAYAAAAYAAFSKLSDEKKAEREHIIRTEITGYFPPEGSSPQDLVDHMIPRSFLFPTEDLEGQCREFCAKYIGVCRKSPASYGREELALVSKRNLAFRLAAGGGDILEQVPVKRLQAEVLDYLQFGELQPVGHAVRQILEAEDAYRSHLDLLDRTCSWISSWRIAEGYARAVVRIPGSTPEEFEAALQEEMANAMDRQNSSYAGLLQLVYQMIRKGIPTGEEAAAQNTMLERLRQSANDEVRKIVGSSVTEAENLLRAETDRHIAELMAKVASEPETISNQPKQPPPRPARRRRGGKRGGRKTSIIRQPPPPVSSGKPAVNDKAVKARLSARLKDLRNELGGLRQRIQGVDDQMCAGIENHISMATGEIDICLGRKSQTKNDLLDAVHQADDAYRMVRQNIQDLEAVAADFDDFDQAVRTAIANETIVYGKEHGGALCRGAGGIPWGAVSARYHNKLLPSAFQIEAGGVTRLLCEDEALALYVTASSTSGYDFCISCHYWRRRPGSDAPPAGGDGTMNPGQWYDTMVPCFVLHVPVTQ